MTDSGLQLSASGTARKRAMLDQLQRAVVTRRRRRKSTRIAVLGLMITAALVWSLRASDESPQSQQGVVQRAEPEHANEHPGEYGLHMDFASFQVVRDDADVLSRFRTAPRALPQELFIDDSQLLECLRDARHESGLMRVGDRVTLTEPLAAE